MNCVLRNFASVHFIATNGNLVHSSPVMFEKTPMTLSVAVWEEVINMRQNDLFLVAFTRHLLFTYFYDMG